jgi:hypothetical protein
MDQKKTKNKKQKKTPDFALLEHTIFKLVPKKKIELFVNVKEPRIYNLFSHAPYRVDDTSHVCSVVNGLRTFDIGNKSHKLIDMV